MLNETKENLFSRKEFLKRVKDNSEKWDLVIIGGGATGLGIAVDAASRGFKTLLVEQADFSSGTSSKSTKLVHGGVRYLGQGNIALVKEALYERGLMLKNAPHLVKMRGFVIPAFRWWEKYFYGIGLKIYDWMARGLRLDKTVLLSAEQVRGLLPNLRKKKVGGGVLYFDGQFDDARLAINIAQTAAENGAVLLNYMKVRGLSKDFNGKINGVQIEDKLSGDVLDITAKTVINATGVFVDDILGMNEKSTPAMVKASQGIHLVLDKSFMPGAHALMIPATSDGRVLFAVPWHNHLLVGTTDTPVDTHNLEPVALEQEITFILETLKDYLDKKPQRKDVLSVFAGLRPLVQPSEEKGTKDISRDHKLQTAESGLITITGGKWTTYRRMAEHVVNEAINVGGLKKVACFTEDLKIHGYMQDSNVGGLGVYGSDAEKIRNLIAEIPILGAQIHPDYPYLQAQVVWAVKNEMAQTLEDVLARRLGVLFVDARGALLMADKVAELMAELMDKDQHWQDQQLAAFRALSKNYILEPVNPKMEAVVNN